MPKGTKTAVDTKAVGLALLAAGNTPEWVSEKLGLSVNTVKDWKRKMPAPEPRPAGSTIDNLLQELMEASLRSLIAQQEAISDPVFIKRQRIDQVGFNFGITVDKIVRLFNARESAMQREIELIRERRGLPETVDG